MSSFMRDQKHGRVVWVWVWVWVSINIYFINSPVRLFFKGTQTPELDETQPDGPDVSCEVLPLPVGWDSRLSERAASSIYLSFFGKAQPPPGCIAAVWLLDAQSSPP